MRLIAAKQRVAHVVEKAALLLLRLLPCIAELRLQFLDSSISALKRFILHQGRLNERIRCIRSLLHAFRNQALCYRIARRSQVAPSVRKARSPAAVRGVSSASSVPVVHLRGVSFLSKNDSDAASTKQVKCSRRQYHITTNERFNLTM